MIAASLLLRSVYKEVFAIGVFRYDPTIIVIYAVYVVFSDCDDDSEERIVSIYPEDGSDTFLRNFSSHQHDHTDDRSGQY